MSEDKQKFRLGVVASAYSGKLLCSIDSMYKILNFMTGDNLYTHQLPRAMDVCRPYLQKQFGWLADFDFTAVSRDDWHGFLTGLEKEHGEFLEVSKLPDGAWEHKNPLLELLSMMDEPNNLQTGENDD